MTNEEAIQFFEGCKFHCDNEEPINMAIAAIEKQIPKKPIKDSIPFYRLGEPYYDWLCPICNKWLAYECDAQRTSIHHCHCGQALDWSGGEEECRD